MLKLIPSTLASNMKRHLHIDKSIPLNFINGNRVAAQSNHSNLPNICPASGDVICNIPCSDPYEVDRAVKSACSSYFEWSKLGGRIRGQYLTAASQVIRNRIEDIARMEVLDTGKPIWEARIDISGCADTFEYYGGIAASIKGDHFDVGNNNFALVRREPLGVVAGIGAWNYPFQVMAWKVAPALACGNTFVFKPSQLTPLTAVILAEILTEVGVPPGVINVVQGDGMTGEALCKHENVSKVTFTGSVDTGRKITKMCADEMKKVTMELGGKSALLVFSDCDMTNAIKATMLGNFLSQGEVCSNCTRVFVERKIFDEFKAKLMLATKKMIIGDPENDSTMVGAVISEEHGKKIKEYIESAQAEGATILCGGERVTMLEPHLKGCFISPCIISNCTDDMTVVKEEIFGPVVTLLSFDSEDEAVSRANASPYGLAAGVMTKDIQRAHRVSSALQAGIVWINNYNVFPPEVPFGGCKLSGFGRENGLAAISDFTQLKTVYVEMNKEIDCPIYL